MIKKDEKNLPPPYGNSTKQSQMDINNVHINNYTYFYLWLRNPNDILF